MAAPVDGSSPSSDMQDLDNRSLVPPPPNSNASSPISPKTVSSLDNVSWSSSSGQSSTYSPTHASGKQVLGNLDGPCSTGNNLNPIPSSPSGSKDLVHYESPAASLPSENLFFPTPPNETLAYHSLAPSSLPVDNNQPLDHYPHQPISVIMPEHNVSAVDRPFSQVENETIDFSLFGVEGDDLEEHHSSSDTECYHQDEDAVVPQKPYDSEDEIVDCKPCPQSQWSSQQSSWSEAREPMEIIPTGVGAGFSNLGNTCFMNSILQCFTHTVPLIQALLAYDHPMPCDRNREGFCVICVLHDHIQLSLHSSGGVISPSRFVDNLEYFSSFFQKYQQEDAHEFLQSILDKLERCCLDSKKMDESSSSHDINIVEQVFGGRLLSRLWCCNCGHYSDTYEASVGLSLEIEEVDTLQSALSSFTSVERLEDPEIKFICEICKERVSKEKQLMVDQAPSVAAFHLKRFKNDGISVDKIYKHVKFPLELDLQPYTSSSWSSEEQELKYYLYAFVEHIGGSLTSGHYFCYVRSSPDTWHKLDDSQVTRVEEDYVLSQDAYILFYARQDTPWFSTIFEGIKPRLAGKKNSSPKSVLDAGKTDFNSDHGVEDNDNCEMNKSSNNEISEQINEWSQLIETTDAAEDVFVEDSYNSRQNGSDCRECEDGIPMIAGSPPLMDNEYEQSQNLLSLEKNNCDQRGTKVARNNSSPSALTGSDGSGVPREHRDAVYCIPRDHLKSEKPGSRKRPPSKLPMDTNRSLALRCLKKHIPGSRAAMLSTAMGVGQDGDPNKRKRSHSTPCKRSTPPAHRSHNEEQLMRSAAAVLR